MRALRNLTLHRQESEQVRLAAQCGFALQPEPEGVQVPSGVDGLIEASIELARKLAECSQSGAAVLLGGHTRVWIAALDRLDAEHRPRPDLCYFDTKRERDEYGRFVFKPEEIVMLPGVQRLPGVKSH